MPDLSFPSCPGVVWFLIGHDDLVGFVGNCSNVHNYIQIASKLLWAFSLESYSFLPLLDLQPGVWVSLYHPAKASTLWRG